MSDHNGTPTGDIEGVLDCALNRLWTEPEDILDLPDWRQVPGRLVKALREALTIRTVDQLDALPEGSVINVPHKLTASSVELRHERWWPSRASGPYHHGFRDELLPALLIWHPSWARAGVDRG